MKTVIVDLKGKYAAALTESGEVKKIVNNHYSIGDEIDLYDIREVRQHTFPRAVKRIVAVAAAIIILATGSIATAYALPYGTVTIDGDASIEYTVNCFDYVLDVKALNEDGEAILSEIDQSSLRHHKVGDAVETTVEQIEHDGYLDDTDKGISITASTGNDQHTDRLQKDIEDRVYLDMGITQKNPAQTTENDNQAHDNNTPADSNPADDGQQKQEQVQSPNQDQHENNPQQDEVRQNDTPQYQGGDNVPNQNSDQNRNNSNQPQMQPKQ